MKSGVYVFALEGSTVIEQVLPSALRHPHYEMTVVGFLAEIDIRFVSTSNASPND